MFLDDELFNVCKKSKLITVEDVHNTTRQVYRHCEYYVKSNVQPGMFIKDVQVVFKWLFTHFDLFVAQLKKSEDEKMKLLGDYFNNNHIRDIYYKDDKIKKFLSL